MRRASRNGRRLALLALMLALVPGHFVRSPPPLGGSDAVRITALPVAQPRNWPVGLRLEAAWHLASEHADFFGFSALLRNADGQFRAFNDAGGQVWFSVHPPVVRASFAHLPRDAAISSLADTESAVLDRATGRLWIGYEQHQAIRRISADGTSALVKPPPMAQWGANSGPEAMTRLAGGRFLVLSEFGQEGLLFNGDPVAGAGLVQFRIAPEGGYAPTDMVALPDGRVMVLLRQIRWGLPPFASMLAIADPADIAPGQIWELEPLAVIEGPALAENYEGIAIAEDATGGVDIWLISDDNRSAFQRTVLLQLHWDGAEKQTAREAEAREP